MVVLCWKISLESMLSFEAFFFPFRWLHQVRHPNVYTNRHSFKLSKDWYGKVRIYKEDDSVYQLYRDKRLVCSTHGSLV